MRSWPCRCASPSRACYLTGNYPHTNGIHHNQIRWNQQLHTLPRTLQSAGYRTAHIGKFHLDGDDRVQPGYDYWAAQINQGSYVNPRKNINGQSVDLPVPVMDSHTCLSWADVGAWCPVPNP